MMVEQPVGHAKKTATRMLPSGQRAENHRHRHGLDEMMIEARTERLVSLLVALEPADGDQHGRGRVVDVADTSRI